MKNQTLCNSPKERSSFSVRLFPSPIGKGVGGGEGGSCRGFSIRNYSLKEALQLSDDEFISVGFHPWHLTDIKEDEWTVLEYLSTKNHVIMIGEAGLDKLCDTDFGLQLTVFTRQAEIAQKVNKPLLIHCVKAWQEIMEIKDKLQLTIPCIIHGFRGKPELAKSLLQHGFYLSFGERYNTESLKITPLEQLCTETDESKISIQSIYRQIAEDKGIDVQKLCQQANHIIVPLFLQKSAATYIDIHCH